MISSDNTEIQRDRKNVKKIKVDKNLKTELEEILVKQMFDSNDKKQKVYPNGRKSIFRKSSKR